MVLSEVSGIAFTANPISGQRDEIVIEASYGLGDAIVSGQVDPDRYFLDVSSWNIAKRQPGTKQAASLPHPAGGTELVQGPSNLSQALTDEQILQLARLAQRVENHFGAPQDIEWAYASNMFYLVQSRPITSLYPLPEGNRIDGDLHVYINFNAIQGITGPITPLGIDAIRLLFGGILQVLNIHNPMQEVLLAAGNRLFLDFGDLPGDPVLHNFVLNFLASTEPGAHQTLIRLIEEGRIQPKRVLTLRRAFSLLVSLLPILRSAQVGWMHPENVRPRVTAKGDLFLARVKEHLETANDLLSKLASMEGDLSHAETISLDVMPVALLASETIPLLDRWLCSWLGEKPGAVQPLLQPPGNVTVKMNLSLWAAAQEIRANSDALDLIKTDKVRSLVEDFRQSSSPTAGCTHRVFEQIWDARHCRNRPGETTLAG
jgi:pyruvate,water dikinase